MQLFVLLILDNEEFQSTPLAYFLLTNSSCNSLQTNVAKSIGYMQNIAVAPGELDIQVT